MSNPHDLGVAKLASSGLTTADNLGMTFLSAAQTTALHPSFQPLCSLHIPYFDIMGNPLSDWPGCPPFYRLRYLEVGTGFTTLAAKKPIRYTQEPNTRPTAYFPPNQEWVPIVENPDEPLLITEGELKAAKACKEGFPTIGLGGVHNWRSLKNGVVWLDSLAPVVWPRRNVYICFDSDYRTNPQVCAALHDLAEILHQFGAYVHLVTLPDIIGLSKTGLDDFLLAEPDGLAPLLASATPLGLTKPLWQLNARYAYAQHPGLIINQQTLTKTAPQAFTAHVESTRLYQERRLKNDGTVSFAPVAAAVAWLQWPLRTEVSRLTYQPGHETFTNGEFNIWPGWGLTPAAGDASPFLELVDHLFSTAEPEAKTWFLRWCAYPLQHPGFKMFSSVVLHGIRHGTGKSLLGLTLGRIYGKNFTEISQMDIHNSFNEWAEGKQFVMGDDVTGSNIRAEADFLKKLITQRELRVNGKYVPTYVVPDCINFIFTANHPDSFFLEDDDRRFFIHEVQVAPLSEAFYMNYDLWVDSGGAAAVFDYLMKLDIGDFNPSAPACRTAAKERMIANVQSDLAGWVRQLLATPEFILRVGEIALTSDLYTSKELLQIYDPSGKTGTTANGLGRELARAGVRQVCGGKPIRAPDGSQGRYYAVRHMDYWLTASTSLVTEHLAQNRPSTKSAKY